MRVNFNKTNYGIKQKILLKDVKCKCIRLSVKKVNHSNTKQLIARLILLPTNTTSSDFLSDSSVIGRFSPIRSFKVKIWHNVR